MSRDIDTGTDDLLARVEGNVGVITFNRPERYNAIAREIMQTHGAEVVDLYAFALARQEQIQPRVDVHFTKQGSRLLGEHVAAKVRAALAK